MLKSKYLTESQQGDLIIAPDTLTFFYKGEIAAEVYFRIENGSFRPYVCVKKTKIETRLINSLKETYFKDVGLFLKTILSNEYPFYRGEGIEPTHYSYAKLRPDVIISNDVVYSNKSDEFKNLDYVRINALIQPCEQPEY